MIVGVAIKQGDKVYSLPKPARHNDVIELIYERTLQRPVTGTQVFVDSGLNFMDRIEAASYALDHKQIEELRWPPQLFSEDLW